MTLADTAPADPEALEIALDTEPPPRPKGREGMVTAVMQIMTRGQWERGHTGPKLAATWGLSDDYLKKIAAEASRRVLAAIDPAAVRQRLAHVFGHSVDVLEGKLDGPDALDAARALPGNASGYAALVGADAPKRREVTITEAKETAWWRQEIEAQAAFLQEADKAIQGFLTRYEAHEAWTEWCAEQKRERTLAAEYVRRLGSPIHVAGQPPEPEVAEAEWSEP